MKRNIIRQGNKSYTFTLPVGWIRENNLDQGEEIEIVEEENKLILSVPSDIKKTTAEISLNIKDFTEKAIRNILNQSYRKGYDKIKLIFNSKDQIEIIHDIVKETLLGFEITDEKDDYCIIQNIAEPSAEKYDVILRKIFLIIKQESEEILQELQSGKLEKLRKRKYLKNTVDNYTNFARRVIVNHKIGGTRNSYLYFFEVGHLSVIHHAYFYLYSILHKQTNQKLSKETINLLGHANEMFADFYEAFYKLDSNALHKIGLRKVNMFNSQIYPLLKKGGVDAIALYHIGELIRLIQMATTGLFGLLKES